MKKNIVATFALLCLLLAFTQINSSHSATLNLNIRTEKTSYDIGELVTLSGNLTRDGSLLPDALVSMEITDPSNNSFLVRTLNTSQTVAGTWPVGISQFFPCDSSGNPKYSFKVGLAVNLGFKFTIVNNQPTPRDIIAILTIIYSDNVPCELNSFLVFNGTLGPSGSISRTMWPVPLTSPPLGLAKAYLNVLTNWPRNDGFALCPEKSTTFTISTTGLSELPEFQIQEQILQLTNGTFSISFIVNPFGGTLGDYDIHATSFVSPNFASDDVIFTAHLVGDITSLVEGVKDGKCDMKDVSAVARQFGKTVPPAPAYCDILTDGKIDMRDISMVAKDFGKWGVLP